MSVVAQTTASRALTMHHHQRTEAPMKTDTQLQTEVIAELAWEPSVHAAQIGVESRTAWSRSPAMSAVSWKSGMPSEQPCGSMA